MKITECPVCRRRKGYDDLLCPACAGLADPLLMFWRANLVTAGSDDAQHKLIGVNQEIVAKLKGAREDSKPFGYDVEILCLGMPQRRTFHWRGTEAACRRKARLQSTFREVVSITPLSKTEWVRAYGVPGMRL